MKCSFRKSHCRRLSRRSRSPANCHKVVDGHSVGGRRVRAHSRPKGCADPSVIRLQAAARRASARKRADVLRKARRTLFKLNPITKAFTEADDLADRDAAAFGLAHMDVAFPASVDAEMRALLSLPVAGVSKPPSSDPIAYPRGTGTEMPHLLRLCFWIGRRLSAHTARDTTGYAHPDVARDCGQYAVKRVREPSIEKLSRRIVYGVLRNCIVTTEPNAAYKHSFWYKRSVEWGHRSVARSVRRSEHTLMVFTFGTESTTFLNQLGVFMEVSRLALAAT